MNSFEGVEKAAAAHEAREAVGSSQRRTGSRTGDVEAALMHYLSTEQYHERPAGAHDLDDDERRDSDDSS